MEMVLSETGNSGGGVGLRECVEENPAFSKQRSPGECRKCVPIA